MTTSETVDDAANAAAYRVADAENKAYMAAEAVKEAERISKMAEDTDSMLQLVKEIYERCNAESTFAYLVINFYCSTILLIHWLLFVSLGLSLQARAVKLSPWLRLVGYPLNFSFSRIKRRLYN